MFTWICPKCGSEVPPAYSDCPRCAPQQVRATPKVTEPVGSRPPAEQPPATERSPIWERSAMPERPVFTDRSPFSHPAAQQPVPDTATSMFDLRPSSSFDPRPATPPPAPPPPPV